MNRNRHQNKTGKGKEMRHDGLLREASKQIRTRALLSTLSISWKRGTNYTYKARNDQPGERAEVQAAEGQGRRQVDGESPYAPPLVVKVEEGGRPSSVPFLDEQIPARCAALMRPSPSAAPSIKQTVGGGWAEIKLGVAPGHGRGTEGKGGVVGREDARWKASAGAARRSET